MNLYNRLVATPPAITIERGVNGRVLYPKYSSGLEYAYVRGVYTEIQGSRFFTTNPYKKGTKLYEYYRAGVANAKKGLYV